MTENEAIVLAVQCIVGAAKDAGAFGAPSGIVYAAMSAHGMRLAAYQSLCNALENFGVIRQEHDCLFWTGVELADAMGGS